MSPAPEAPLRHASTVAGLTLASRVLGFVRDAAVAALFGTGAVADAAVAGLAVPQLARRLLSEGALNAAVVPGLLDAERTAGIEEARARAAAALALITAAASLLAILMTVLMPLVIALLAPGFDWDGERAEGAVLVGRLAIVCLPLMAMAGVLAAIANASGRATLPAFAPVLSNIAVLLVLGIVFLVPESRALAWLATASVAGAVAQLGLMLAAVKGTRLAPARLVRTALPTAWPMLAEAGPSLLASALPQLRFLVAGAAASGTVGGVAALFYAGRLIELPLGVIGASTGAVLLPLLAAQARSTSGNAGARAAEAALALTLPAGLGLMVLAEPIVAVLFKRGAFDAEAVAATSHVLALLAFALPVQAVEKILAAIAFAHGAGRLATRTGLAALVAGGAAGFALAGPLGIAGPALGILVSSAVGLVGLALGLARRGLLTLDDAARRRLPRLAFAALAMTLAVLAAGRLLAGPLAAHGLAGFAALAACIVLGVAIYGVAAQLSGALDLKVLRR
ncbi:MAG: virulence factor family protein [Xanthobacteraceae bacterium]|jgi:putative peptidoglycan lipid II flippase|nr:virulence factor family protein [Xanthobacteraceae bacterium]